MILNTHLLSDAELRHLYLVENNRFSEGMDTGMKFLDLKQIRKNLREIAIEQRIRKSDFLEGFVPTRI